MLHAGRPYWDELASSAIVRCSRRFNVPLKRLGNLVLGCSGWRMSFAGASPLEPIAGLFGLSEEELLWNHTAFPYATAFMTGDAYERALRNAMGAARDRVGLASVLQNATMGVRERQFCTQCASEELDSTGESFWHRSHNLPGVWACTKHERSLSALRMPLPPTRSVSTLLPHEISAAASRTRNTTKAMLAVARLSHEWLGRAWGPGEIGDASVYRALARSRGWLEGELVNREALHRLVVGHFPSTFLKATALPATASTNEWPALMLRCTNSLAFAPVKHAILHTVLGRTRDPSEQVLDHASSGPPKTGPTLIDSFYAGAARRALRKAVKSGETYTTEQFLRSFGALSPYRHLGPDLPLLRSIVREFRSSEATVKRLGPDKALFRRSG